MKKIPVFGGWPIWKLVPPGQDGVWWVQATAADGIAYWRCARCDRGGYGFSLLVARLRHRFHRCRPCPTCLHGDA